MPLDQIELIRAVLKGKRLSPIEEVLQIVRSLPHGHVVAVVGTLNKLGVAGRKGD